MLEYLAYFMPFLIVTNAITTITVVFAIGVFMSYVDRIDKDK